MSLQQQLYSTKMLLNITTLYILLDVHVFMYL